jgi:urease accessory protein
MLTLNEVLAQPGAADDELVLSFDQRQHSRLRALLASGREAALLLPHGTVLRHGDQLRGPDPASGSEVTVRVVARPEALYRITGPGLIRAAYHLGNLHVPLEIGADELRIGRDTVLRDMLLGLGFQVEDVVAPFDPEPGAYGGGHRLEGEAGHGPPIHHGP